MHTQSTWISIILLTFTVDFNEDFKGKKYPEMFLCLPIFWRYPDTFITLQITMLFPSGWQIVAWGWSTHPQQELLMANLQKKLPGHGKAAFKWTESTSVVHPWLAPSGFWPLLTALIRESSGCALEVPSTTASHIHIPSFLPPLHSFHECLSPFLTGVEKNINKAKNRLLSIPTEYIFL